MRAAVPDRIVDVGSRMVALPQSVPPRALKAADLGQAEPSTVLDSMTLRFRMTDGQKAALTQLLADQQNPASPRYHQWLTPEQFAAQFGLSSGDLATVAHWLTSQGFKIVSNSRSSTFIRFSGTAADAGAAFQTSIHRVSLDGAEHVTNVKELSLPSGIAGVVEAVTGMNNFRLRPRSIVRQVPARQIPDRQMAANADPNFTSSLSGNTFIAPGDFYTIYDVRPLLTGGANGAGMTIAVAGQTDLGLTDVAAFRAAAGLSANLPQTKLYGADPGTVATDVPEADLDVEWSGAVAPGATIIFAYSKNALDALQDLIDDRLAPIASVSYGDCESNIGEPGLDMLNQIFMQANAQGMTVIGAAGDSGATDCDYMANTATQGLTVDFPASSPYVTGLGGTMFDEGSGKYFGTTNDANGGSAISYIPEAVWNETSALGLLASGGGGFSAYFTKPSWQTGTGVPNDFARDVPDVSLNAALAHDGYLFCAQGSCVNGFRTSATPTGSCTTGNCLNVVGGTSVAVPAFAGILTLVEQKIGATTGVGNANPEIYALANSTYHGAVFHDITVGNNGSVCMAGSTDCPSGGSIGYNAGVGYDLATGWGSVDAFDLATSWPLVTPVAVPTMIASSTTLRESAASVDAGKLVTLTAAVANGSTTPQAVAPTGTVQFLVDDVATGSAVTLAAGAATYALDTTALSSGNHILSAAYSGDATYGSSKGSVNLDVISATAPDFVLTPATTTVTVNSGGNAPGAVFTVTPSNGFTGSVLFRTLSTSGPLQASAIFTLNPVVISSAAAGTTTLNLSAYAPDARSGTGKFRIGSGAALAWLVLLIVPRRRRIGRLLGVMLSVGILGGMLGMGGCGSGSSANSAQNNTAPGSYTIDVTASGMDATTGVQVTHTVTVTFVVQ